MNKWLIVWFSVFCLNFAIQAKTVVKEVNGQWRFFVDEQPFIVKGVTFGQEVSKETIGTYLKDLNFLGVNVIRLWGTNDKTQILLDSAQGYGIKVMLGIWLRHGRPGMEGDDSFDYLTDSKGMTDMYNDAIATVNKYKNHPAVLTWGVGNEVYLNIATDKEKKAYSLFLEKVCKQIKTLDPDHPITSVEAWTFGLKWWKKYVPSIDILGINCYGAGAATLPEKILEEKINKPYMVTEFGVTGEWDAREDKNGIKIEPTDDQKYKAIAPGFNDWILSKPTCLGGFIFHYGNGNDFGSPWLLLFHNGMYRPQYWATREAFTGLKPINNVPVIAKFSLPDATYSAGSWVNVELEVSDVEEDELAISFYYNQRSGSRTRKSQLNKMELRKSRTGGYQIELPEEQGAIKVYVNVKDSYNNVGIASTSIQVTNGDKKPNIVAKASLPFYVYQDGENQSYIPSAYMGNTRFMGLDIMNKEEAHIGDHCIRINYGDSDGWYGLGFVDPPNDWGDKLGGYNLTGATIYSFWAKSDKPNIEVKIGYGLIGKDKPYPDSDKKSIKVKLNTEWTEYTIDVSEADLSCIRSGLVFFGDGVGRTYTVWIDDVQFK